MRNQKAPASADSDDDMEPIEWMEPESIYRVTITLFPTSNLFDEGHRIALYVSSSCYPHFDVNPNTGGPAAGGSSKIVKVAENRVWHSHELLSSITLPIVENTPVVVPQFVRVVGAAQPVEDDNDEDDVVDDDDDDDDDDAAEHDGEKTKRTQNGDNEESKT